MLDQATENCIDFLDTYCKEDLAELMQRYPSDRALWIDYDELWRFDSALADDLHEQPDVILGHLTEAVGYVDLPHGLGAEDIDIDLRFTNLPDGLTYSPSELRKDQGGTFVSVTGVLERVTTSDDAPKQLPFECQRCLTVNQMPQSLSSGALNEPHECIGCERKGPFKALLNKGEWYDYAKLRIEDRPEGGRATEAKVTAYVVDDLIDAGGEQGLLGRAGEPVTVTGIVHRVQKGGRGESDLLFDHMIEVRGIEFERDDETVDVAKHREAFEELAAKENAVDLFAESISPELHATKAWDAAFEFAVAYLFGSPRIDIANGPTYRGDLHFLIISDYGMGKSTFKKDVAAYSPKCISKSTTALSSGVGLTAAAVKDDFGEGQWTLKPGLLVRANGGHLILDEIDKGPDELTDMNDAIEGEQTVDIEKAGMSATYQSRTAVMALGNPIDGRFNHHQPTAQQLGMSESLLSRFDGIVTMQDTADETQDRAVAESFGRAYTEAQEAQYGDREDFDTLNRPVPIDVGRAWIQHAREEVHPLLSIEQFRQLEEWYATEVRTLNKSYASDDGDGKDMPVPATPRVLASAAKMSIAFARVHLRDEVQQVDIDRAKRLTKQLVKNNWNGEEFDVAHGQGGRSQKDKKSMIRGVIKDNPGIDMDGIASKVGMDREAVEYHVQAFKDTGRVYEPQTGEFRWT